MFVGFSNLSLRHGVIRSFLISSDFFISLVVVDRIKFLISFPIYLVSITLGAHIINFRKKFFRGSRHERAPKIIDNQDKM